MSGVNTLSRDEIFAQLKSELCSLFELKPEQVTAQARLYDDLDLDSIDAVDLIVKLKPIVGKRLQPDAFKAVRTLDDVVNALQGLLDEPAAG